MCQGEKIICSPNENSTTESDDSTGGFNYVQNPLLPSFGNVINSEKVIFTPPTGSDTMQLKGSQTQVATKLICVSAMKDFENKSLEEIRFVDYIDGKKVFSTIFRPSNSEKQQKDNTNSTIAINSSIASNPSMAANIFASPVKHTSLFGNSALNSKDAFNPFKPYYGCFEANNPLPSSRIFAAPCPALPQVFLGPATIQPSLATTTTPPPIKSNNKASFGTFDGVGQHLQQLKIKESFDTNQSNFGSFGSIQIFVPPTDQETVNYKLICISAMKNFANKSLEELRSVDYVTGKKLNSKNVFSSFNFKQQQKNKLFNFNKKPELISATNSTTMENDGTFTFVFNISVPMNFK